MAPAGREYDSDAATWHGGSSWDNQTMFDASGKPLDSINIWRLVRTDAKSTRIYVEEIESPAETIEIGCVFTARHRYRARHHRFADDH